MTTKRSFARTSTAIVDPKHPKFTRRYRIRIPVEIRVAEEWNEAQRPSYKDEFLILEVPGRDSLDALQILGSKISSLLTGGSGWKFEESRTAPGIAPLEEQLVSVPIERPRSKAKNR